MEKRKEEKRNKKKESMEKRKEEKRKRKEEKRKTVVCIVCKKSIKAYNVSKHMKSKTCMKNIK